MKCNPCFFLCVIHNDFDFIVKLSTTQSIKGEPFIHQALSQPEVISATKLWKGNICKFLLYNSENISSCKEAYANRFVYRKIKFEFYTRICRYTKDSFFIKISKISFFYELKETIQGGPKLLVNSVYV